VRCADVWYRPFDVLSESESLRSRIVSELISRECDNLGGVAPSRSGFTVRNRITSGLESHATGAEWMVLLTTHVPSENSLLVVSLPFVAVGEEHFSIRADVMGVFEVNVAAPVALAGSSHYRIPRADRRGSYRFGSVPRPPRRQTPARPGCDLAELDSSRDIFRVPDPEASSKAVRRYE